MNFDLPQFNGKAIIFIGRGLEGLSFEKFIMTHSAASSFLFIDQQDDPAYLESLRNMDFTKTVIVKTAGCPGRLVPAPYTTPTKVFFECVKQLGATVVGVTGTKGKTTTTSIIGAMLQAGKKHVKVCGNIGIPMLDALDKSSHETIFVVELSSYQLAELETSPHIGVITNLYNDHADYHGSQELYYEAKHNIMRYMNAQDTLIYNSEFTTITDWLAQSPCQTVTITDKGPVDLTKTKLIGAHNALNAHMALQAAILCGIDETTCLKALESFEPVPHRLQKVAIKNRVTYIDDAIGSNPEATIAGITTIIKDLGPIGCIMLGGKDRNYEYWPLVQLIARINVPCLILFPDTGAKIKMLMPASYMVNIHESTDMAEAVLWAADHCPADSICLLSTAAPSTVLWKNFEEKGTLFQQAVLALPDGNTE